MASQNKRGEEKKLESCMELVELGSQHAGKDGRRERAGLDIRGPLEEGGAAITRLFEL